jgi:hypothetical protein
VAKAALQAHRGLVVPERLAALILQTPGIDIETCAQTERGLEAAAQVFPAGNRQIAALNRAGLGRAIKAAIDAAIDQTANADAGRLGRRRQHGRQKSETCGTSNASTQAHAGGSP